MFYGTLGAPAPFLHGANSKMFPSDHFTWRIMMKNWHYETWNPTKFILNVYPDVRIYFGSGKPRWSFQDSRMAGRMHGQDDYGRAILHEWKDYGFSMTIEKMSMLDPSRVFVDNYGTLHAAR